MDFKTLHIGKLIKKKVMESGMETSRICNFLQLEEEEIDLMYQSASMKTEILLRWSKLLKYDFFRLYSQHLILYAPQQGINYNKKPATESKLPEFRKNIYTQEVIDFILELIQTGKKTKLEIVEEYRIPKTTLYKWISKNKTK
ncbi:transposase [uncultured Chryseobacterium sp.]|uniref:transposase n=1 Tax=uncultured Chryseobacterium sp. TaxID=259322 RepID=UPI0025D40957|nr:transposase [uncultured Chryseobacterium sp.]